MYKTINNTLVSQLTGNAGLTDYIKSIYIMEDEFALKYYGKLYNELTIWEQRHIISQIDAALT